LAEAKFGSEFLKNRRHHVKPLISNEFQVSERVIRHGRVGTLWGTAWNRHVKSGPHQWNHRCFAAAQRLGVGIVAEACLPCCWGQRGRIGVNHFVPAGWVNARLSAYPRTCQKGHWDHRNEQLAALQ
jgi:hypothetical protein